MGILGPRKEAYVDSPRDSPKISRSSLSLVDPASWCVRTRSGTHLEYLNPVLNNRVTAIGPGMVFVM